MGVVYKALDTRLQRHVALKVLPPAVSSDAGRRQRFLREAQAASALNDPHIITIHDIFEHDGTDVLVMELVEGRTLREVMQGPLPVDQTVTWGRQIADALGLAHGAGIVHRDLKPGNVMVTDRGVLKVLDFGLAKVAATAVDTTVTAQTAAGDVLGTIEYMSPEQARGEAVDHRTDIYSLGTMLYEMLAGRRPFQSENRLALLHEIIHGTAIPLRTLVPTVPEALSDAVAKALERDPKMRFQSMWELSSALKFSLEAGAPPASATTTSVPVVATRRRRSRLLAVAAGIVALAGVGVGYQAWRSRAATVQPTASVMPAATVVQAPTTAFEFTQHGLGLLRRFDRAGNVDKAIASFESAITLDKTFAPAWAGLARAFWRQVVETGDASWGARGRDAAGQATALDPYLADGHVSLALVQVDAGDLRAARSALDRAQLLDPENAGVLRSLGDIENRGGRKAEAARYYERALARDPTNWELMFMRGTASYDQARYADALAWFKRSADEVGDSATPHLLAGAASHMLGDYAGAAAAFQQSIGIQPSASAYTNLGTALFFQGRYRESVEAFEHAVDMEPSRPIMWGNVADAYRWVPGNAARSREAFRRAIQLLSTSLANNPDDVRNRSRLALYLAKSGDITQALAELGKVPTHNVTEVNTLFRGAVTYEIAGDRTAALTLLERALDHGYSPTEVRMDPELTSLRNDARYHRLAARFEAKIQAKP